MNLKRRCSNLGHVDKEFCLQNILEKLIAQQHKAVWNYPGEIDGFFFFIDDVYINWFNIQHEKEISIIVEYQMRFWRLPSIGDSSVTSVVQ